VNFLTRFLISFHALFSQFDVGYVLNTQRKHLLRGAAASGIRTKTVLNQDRTAIDHNGLPSRESFLHQKQICLRDLGSFAHSSNRDTVAHAFV
jgi:hypothetical protein